MNHSSENQVMREITPLSDKDCFYIGERIKTEFTGLHPDERGQQLMGRYIAKEIRNNYY